MTDLMMMFWKDGGRNLELGARKAMSVESSVSCSRGAWKMRLWRAVHTTEAWLGAFQRETKTLLRGFE